MAQKSHGPTKSTGGEAPGGSGRGPKRRRQEGFDLGSTRWQVGTIIGQVRSSLDKATRARKVILNAELRLRSGSASQVPGIAGGTQNPAELRTRLSEARREYEEAMHEGVAAIRKLRSLSRELQSFLWKQNANLAKLRRGKRRLRKGRDAHFTIGEAALIRDIGYTEDLLRKIADTEAWARRERERVHHKSLSTPASSGKAEQKSTALTSGLGEGGHRINPKERPPRLGTSEKSDH